MKKRIGALFVERGLLTRTQVDEVLFHSQKTGLRFGDAALDLGLVNKHDISRLFGAGHRVDFFYLDPRYFPETTRDIFSLETLIQNGILPLGIKTERKWFKKTATLNVGMLSPDQKPILETIEKLAREKNPQINAVRPYLIIPEQFMTILETVYNASQDVIKTLASKSNNNSLKSLI